MLQWTIDGQIVAEIPIVTGTCDIHCTELNSSLGKWRTLIRNDDGSYSNRASVTLDVPASKGFLL